ncbi:hypothetical protein AVEN_253595-1 [Araneus ventricosus]|uniref:Uncharacterized protein n=1 Tax=Araneus ventricosus TaxID=182803 RepID=A0A4Y2CBE7_ARAVE|nr:hypothetical protein AVEN_253595-1 [Araneus ventricosus]
MNTSDGWTDIQQKGTVEAVSTGFPFPEKQGMCMPVTSGHFLHCLRRYCQSSVTLTVQNVIRDILSSPSLSLFFRERERHSNVLVTGWNEEQKEEEDRTNDPKGICMQSVKFIPSACFILFFISFFLRGGCGVVPLLPSGCSKRF